MVSGESIHGRDEDGNAIAQVLLTGWGGVNGLVRQVRSASESETIGQLGDQIRSSDGRGSGNSRVGQYLETVVTTLVTSGSRFCGP